MRAFIRRSSGVMQYGQNDKILDFGCGSGHFAEMMHGRIGAIVCADMSEHYVEVCRAVQRIDNARRARYDRPGSSRERFYESHLPERYPLL